MIPPNGPQCDTCQDFMAILPGNIPNTGVGEYTRNQNAYGMWFTPPDIGITVLCVFANGDRQLGYYIGVVPDVGVGHMVPAVGSSNQYVTTNKNQETYFTDDEYLPVTEINTNNPALSIPVDFLINANQYTVWLLVCCFNKDSTETLNVDP
jgi:hypothetical protein